MLNQSTLTTDTEVVVCPSQVHLQSVKENLRGDIAVGAQDVWTQGNGAFTGETSADMLTDMGVGWVLVGHSERRGKGEADAEVAAKAKYALDKGLSVIACCGEPLESREAGTTNDFVFPQIKAYADAFTKADWEKVVIAYGTCFCCSCVIFLVYHSVYSTMQYHSHIHLFFHSQQNPSGPSELASLPHPNKHKILTLPSVNTLDKSPVPTSLPTLESCMVDLPTQRPLLVCRPRRTLMDFWLEELH
jgi:Triosephosphate isomerase